MSQKLNKERSQWLKFYRVKGFEEAAFFEILKCARV